MCECVRNNAAEQLGGCSMKALTHFSPLVYGNYSHNKGRLSSQRSLLKYFKQQSVWLGDRYLHPVYTNSQHWSFQRERNFELYLMTLKCMYVFDLFVFFACLLIHVSFYSSISETVMKLYLVQLFC